uniref:DUF5641 domain-containing protein n=1 Tax=Megaselia scalaris TaxID=36166 RepID=T1GNN0_MEGSC
EQRFFSNPEPEEERVSLANRWKYLKNIKYNIQILHNIQPRTKWKLQEEPNIFNHKWPIKVVEEVHPGIDGLVRVVTVRGENGKHSRDRL